MLADLIPPPVLFGLVLLLVLVSVEAGYRVGTAVHRRVKNEDASSVSAVIGSILGLLAFILAFTFGIVTDRYDARKALVREEADILRNVWLRSEFLPDSLRAETYILLKAYTRRRIEVVRSGNMAALWKAVADSEADQRRLWDTASRRAGANMDSDVAALYVESVNDLINIQAHRISLGVQARIPPGIWLILYGLVVMGMVGTGYQIGVSGSGRTWSILLLAVAFSVVVLLIVLLDRPNSDFLRVSQQPLEHVLRSMEGVFSPASNH